MAKTMKFLFAIHILLVWCVLTFGHFVNDDDNENKDGVTVTPIPPEVKTELMPRITSKLPRPRPMPPNRGNENPSIYPRRTKATSTTTEALPTSTNSETTTEVQKDIV